MILGIDNLQAMQFEPLRGKRVGLLSHDVAVSALRHTTAEILHHSVNLVAMFGPEHGFRATALAGGKTETYEHPEWHIPVHSLYGKTREPTPEMLEGIDCMVCDLQDLGVRCYTYLATLRNMMRACARAGIPILVLDRPVPLPSCVDGPIREESLDSFVAPAPVPFVYGMTLAEAARWMQKNMIPGAKLDAIPMTVASRDEISFESLPHFVRPSPAICTIEAAMIYPMTVFSEFFPVLDCSRGKELSFQVFGAPWLDPAEFLPMLFNGEFSGIEFSRCVFPAGNKMYEGREIDGIRINVTNRDAFRPFSSAMKLLTLIFREYDSELTWQNPTTRQQWFNALYGMPAIWESITKGESYEYDNSAYLATREEALLYRGMRSRAGNIRGDVLNN